MEFLYLVAALVAVLLLFWFAVSELKRVAFLYKENSFFRDYVVRLFIPLWIIVLVLKSGNILEFSLLLILFLVAYFLALLLFKTIVGSIRVVSRLMWR